MPQLSDLQRKQLIDFLKRILEIPSVDGKNLIRHVLTKQSRVLHDGIWRLEDLTVLAELLASHLLYERDLKSLEALLTEVREHLSQHEYASYAQMLEGLHSGSNGDIALGDSGNVGGNRAVVAESIHGDVLTGEYARSIHAETYNEHVETHTHSIFDQSKQTVGIQYNIARDLVLGPQPALPSTFQHPSPDQISDFTGREIEINTIKQMLTSGDTPYIGLVGMGGVGKTWLAIRVANELEGHFKDGILWADFERITLENALRQFAAPFGIQDEIAKLSDVASMAKRLREVLRDKQILVVINNATNVKNTRLLLTPKSNADKHLLAARTLITTRDRDLLFDIGAEIHQVNPLTFQEAIIFLSQLLGEERVMAKMESAKNIIEKVGGLPLAIRIIGSSLRRQEGMTLQDYENALQDESKRLQRIKDRKDKQLNLEATFELSYGSLDTEVQALLVQLAIFQGPDFDIEAVAAATQYDPFDVMEWLGQLHSLSLINEGLGERDQIADLGVNIGDGVRYRLHPLIKSFALERFNNIAHIDREQLYRRLAHYYIDLAEQHNTPERYKQLDLDWQNIIASLRWANTKAEYEIVTRGALALTHYHLGHIGYLDLRGHWNDAKHILSWALDGLRDEGPSLEKVILLTNLGGFEVRQANYTVAQSLLQDASEALRLLPKKEEVELQQLVIAELKARTYIQQNRSKARQALEDAMGQSITTPSDDIKQQIAYLNIQLSGILTRRGESKRALDLAEQALRTLPDVPSTARLTGLMHLGLAHQAISSPEVCMGYLQDALRLAQQIGDISRMAMLWTNIAWNETRQGNMSKAIEYQEKALKIYRFIGDRYYECGLGINIGQSYLRGGDLLAAREHLTNSVQIAEKHEFLDVEAMAKSSLANLLIHTEQYSYALDLLERAKTICEQLDFGYLLPTVVRQQAEVALGEHDYAQGLVLIDNAIHLSEQTKDKNDIGTSHRTQGCLFHALSREDEASQAWHKSAETLKESDQYEYANTLMVMARAMLSKHDKGTLDPNVVTWLNKAVEIFQQYENQAKVKEAQGMLERLQ